MVPSHLSPCITGRICVPRDEWDLSAPMITPAATLLLSDGLARLYYVTIFLAGVTNDSDSSVNGSAQTPARTYNRVSLGTSLELAPGWSKRQRRMTPSQAPARVG